MDACLAVEREVDKVVSKFTSLNKSINKNIDDQIELIDKLKTQLESSDEELSSVDKTEIKHSTLKISESIVSNRAS